MARLYPRILDILDLHKSGLLEADIAKALGIRQETVRQHMSNYGIIFREDVYGAPAKRNPRKRAPLGSGHVDLEEYIAAQKAREVVPVVGADASVPSLPEPAGGSAPPAESAAKGDEPEDGGSVDGAALSEAPR